MSGVINNKIWIWSNERKDWILTIDKGHLDDDNDRIENGVEDKYYANEDIDVVEVSDLIKLVHLHEPAIYNALKMRFFCENIYTYTGPILLAINPYKRLDMYGDEVINRISNNRGFLDDKFGNNNEPHVYNIAENAYKYLINGDGNQSVLISGESGAGKTVSTKFVLNYLTKIDNNIENENGDGNEDENGDGICSKILKSNPILEAFGNAHTIRNKNSSRFGKFIKLHYDDQNRIMGASVDTYLHEKIRLIGQNEGEFNFHIFYQMGLKSKDFLGKFAKDGTEYHNKSSFDETMDAFRELGFKDVDIEKCLNCVRAVANLGSIHFARIGTDSSKIKSSSVELCSSFCKFMEINNVGDECCKNEMERILTKRSIKVANEIVIKNINKDGAIFCRNGMAMYIYIEMFKWLVRKINQSLFNLRSNRVDNGSVNNGSVNGDKFIGILDIFGFEVFNKNGLEQMFINYTNERLQEVFNDYIFKLEEKEYHKEGIKWNAIDFPDNRECLSVFSRAGGNLFTLLNEECSVPRGNDRNYYEKCKKCLENSETYSVSNKQYVDGNFVVKHYAGNVEYECKDFCDKNKDVISADVVKFLEKSTVWKMFHHGKNSGGDGNGGGKKKRTVCGHFTDQLNGLIGTVRETKLHYIRCLKPNDEDKSDYLTPVRFIDQLKYCGVLEAVKVARAGYAIRYKHNEFVNRYSCLLIADNSWSKSLEKCFETLCVKYLPECSETTYQIGSSKIFIKKNVYDDIEVKRKNACNVVATKIRAIYLGWECWKRYRLMINNSVLVQSVIRMWLAKKRVEMIVKNRAVKCLVNFFRMTVLRIRFIRICNAVKILQNEMRQYWKRLEYWKIVVKFLASVLNDIRKRRFRRMIVWIQCSVRKMIALKELKRLKIEAKSVANLESKYAELKKKYDKLIGNNISVDTDTDDKLSASKIILGDSASVSSLSMSSVSSGTGSIKRSKDDKILIKDLRTKIKELRSENSRKDEIIKGFEKVRVEIASKMERVYMVSEERKVQIEKLKNKLVGNSRKKGGLFG